MHAIMTLVYKRFNDSAASSADVEQFQKNFECARDSFTETIQQLVKQHTDLKKSALEDDSALEAFMQQFSALCSSKSDAYLSATGAFKQNMQENTKQQVSVWEQLISIARELTSLCSIREELLSEHIAETMKERQRQQYQAEVDAVCTRRKQELHELQLNFDRALDFLHQAHQYARKADEWVIKQNWMPKLKKIQREEAIRSYDIYRRFSVAVNTVLFRREQRLENVQRLIRTTQFQLQSAVDTFDTDLPVYRQQLKTLLATQEQIASAVHSLEDEIRKEQQLWGPVEAFLDSCGVDLEPVSLLVQELRRDLMQDHVNAVDELTTKEQKLLDGEKANVRKMWNAVEAAKEMFAEKSPQRAQPKN
jgi:hypothetical protein